MADVHVGHGKLSTAIERLAASHAVLASPQPADVNLASESHGSSSAAPAQGSGRASASESGMMFKVHVQLRHGPIGFLLWLPRGFGNTSTPWPVVFSLHGAGEGEITPEGEAYCARHGCLPPTNGTTLAIVARHGLPHKLENNRPFAENFVVVAPQRPYLHGCAADQPCISAWEDYVPLLDELRAALFDASSRFDRRRASLTGLSAGAIGALAWAGYDNGGEQPWAAVAPFSGMWPGFSSHHSALVPPKMPEAALARVASVPGLHLAACANDHNIPIALGRRGGPPCVLLFLFGNHELMCGFATDAVYERVLEARGGTPAHDKSSLNQRLVYQRFDMCGTPYMPTDTGPALASAYNPLQFGHDSWGPVYSSAEFAAWLANQTLA